MFKIALVQNLSELRNYSYADLRGDLHKMNFEVIEINRNNLNAFIPLLKGGVDCVLFASNSLNDNKIYEFVCEEGFCSAFKEYIDNGGATLVLHQFALKDKENPLPFLPACIERLEKVFGGSNVTLQKTDKLAEQFFLFPNKISVKDICDNCFHNPALSGNYWMLLRSTDAFVPILTDNFGNPVISYMSTKKIAFSSVLLDYQKHLPMLENLLVNLMVDNMSLAILESDIPDTLGFSYFLNSLENNKLYYKKYSNDQEGYSDLITNISLGIHSAILINDRIKSSLPKEISDAINIYGVKIIQLNDRDFGKSDSFVVHTIDKRVSLVFSKLELQIQEELASGYVSGSFMKTVEVLQKLKEFEAYNLTKATYNKETITHVLEKLSTHINEDGSYDKTFGVTCKALWLFLTFLGKNDKLTKSSYNYVKNTSNLDSIREKLERFYTLSAFEKNQKEYLTNNCLSIITEVAENEFHDVTEYDFLTILKVALIIKDQDLLMKLFSYIRENVSIENHEFFNSYVTSIVSSYLIDMYTIIESEKNKEKIRELLFDIVIYLRQVNTSNMSIEEVLQVVCALYKFDSVVSFPVNDLTELIFKTGTFPRDYHAFETQITGYQRSRKELDQAILEKNSVKKENKVLKKYKTLSFVLLSAVAVLLYFLIYLLVVMGDADGNLFVDLFEKIKGSWPSIFSLLIVPGLSFIYNRYLKKKKDDDN